MGEAKRRQRAAGKGTPWPVAKWRHARDVGGIDRVAAPLSLTVAWAFVEIGCWEGWIDLGDPLVATADDATLAARLAAQPVDVRHETLDYLRSNDFLYFLQGALCAEGHDDPGYCDSGEFHRRVDDALDGFDDAPSARALVEGFEELLAIEVAASRPAAR